MIGHEWKFPTGDKKWKNPAKDTNYNFKPELDSDVTHTQKHLGDAENRLGSWDLHQHRNEIHLESDPICSSAGCD
jgi:hypothetical protein